MSPDFPVRLPFRLTAPSPVRLVRGLLRTDGSPRFRASTVRSPATDLDPGTLLPWLTFIACTIAGFQKMKPLASCNDDYFGAQYLHLRCGRQTAFPLASHAVRCRPHAQSSVLAWWLTFGQAGLSSLLMPAFPGTPINKSSC